MNYRTIGLSRQHPEVPGHLFDRACGLQATGRWCPANGLQPAHRFRTRPAQISRPLGFDGTELSRPVISRGIKKINRPWQSKQTRSAPARPSSRTLDFA